jgi:aerobic-type carbon monoxide dehydrogenase small subunit (CoxS/CutS family)
MKAAAFDYVRAGTAADALAGLGEGRDARILAGGQSLVPLMALRLAAPEVLIDITRCPDLLAYGVHEQVLTVGAAVTDAVLERDPAVRAAHPLLVRTLSLIAHPEIRARGTLCGSLAHADPAAELPALLLATDGEVVVDGPRGVRRIPAVDFFPGPFTPALDEGEMVVAARVPTLGPTAGWAVEEISRGPVRPCRGRPVRCGEHAGPVPWRGGGPGGEGTHGGPARCGVGRLLRRRRRAGRRGPRVCRLPTRRGASPRPEGIGRGGAVGGPGGRVKGQEVRVDLRVNGHREVGRAEPRTTLAEFLREELGLTGTHVGCEQGVCGACTVVLDGVAVRSCLVFAVQAADCEVQTVEGLGQDGLHPLQQAFWDAQAVQCGFCTPGFLMTALVALRERVDWDRAKLRERLSGNLCRCTGYQTVVDAVLAAAEVMRDSDGEAAR